MDNAFGNDKQDTVLCAMSIAVRLPTELLASVDRQARGLGMSRNRYILRALERTLKTETRWRTEFIQALEAAREDSDGRKALDELRTAVAARLTRKDAPRLRSMR